MIPNEFYIDSIRTIMADINSYVSTLGLRAAVIKSYDWSGDCVGIYKYGSSANGVIRIGVNLEVLKEYVEELEEDDFITNVEDEAFANLSVTLWHEAGHGLVEHIKRVRRIDTKLGTKIFRGELLKSLQSLYYNEEDTVEDFGEFMAGYGYNSSLYNFIKKYKNILKYNG